MIAGWLAAAAVTVLAVFLAVVPIHTKTKTVTHTVVKTKKVAAAPTLETAMEYVRDHAAGTLTPDKNTLCVVSKNVARGQAHLRVFVCAS